MGHVSSTDARTYDLVAGLLAALYIVFWTSTAYIMERAFSLRVWDVGANYALTNMSAPPALGDGHLSSAPQNLIYLLFTPLVRAFPDPMTIVYAEDVLMGLAGVVIYLIAAHVWQSRSRALLVEGLFLFSYALFGAPFYPNHYEILLSVFFPVAYLLHLLGRPAMAAVFFGLAATTSSFGAVIVGLFVVLLLGPRVWIILRRRARGLGEFLIEQRYYVATGLAAVVIFLLPFVLVGPAITLSYGHFAGNPASPDLAGGTSYVLPEKLIYFVFVFLPFGFVIRRSRYVLLAGPYLALVLVSGSNHYSEFAYQYTFMIGGILFIAWIEALRFRYARAAWPPPAVVESPRELDRIRAWRLPDRARRNSELAWATAVVGVLGLVALPYGPGNAFALAGQTELLPFHNYHYPSLVTVTAYDNALWQMGERVPMSASVLLQENMPMLTNRHVWYEPGSYNGQPIQFALTDPSSMWFDYPPPGFIGPYSTEMVDWVNQLYENRSYSIVQEYQGAILLAQSYNGPVVSFAPYTTFDPGVAFVGPNESRDPSAAGAVTVHWLGNTSVAFRTFALLVLPPGTYNLTYWLKSDRLAASDHLVLGLWGNGTVPTPVATQQVSANSLFGSGIWSPITITFRLPGYTTELYFGAYDAAWDGPLSLRSVYLNQTGVT